MDSYLEYFLFSFNFFAYIPALSNLKSWINPCLQVI